MITEKGTLVGDNSSAITEDCLRHNRNYAQDLRGTSPLLCW